MGQGNFIRIFNTLFGALLNYCKVTDIFKDMALNIWSIFWDTRYTSLIFYEQLFDTNSCVRNHSTVTVILRILAGIAGLLKEFHLCYVNDAL